MADMDLIFPSYAQHERMTAALEAIALNGGAASLDTLDACLLYTSDAADD